MSQPTRLRARLPQVGRVVLASRLTFSWTLQRILALQGSQLRLADLEVGALMMRCKTTCVATRRLPARRSAVHRLSAQDEQPQLVRRRREGARCTERWFAAAPAAAGDVSFEAHLWPRHEF